MCPPNRRLLRTGLAMLLLAVAVTGSGQTPPDEPTASGFSERIEVSIVNVDVWLTDALGEPVTGLTADSFEILHDGRPVPITHFTEVRPGAATRPPAATAEGRDQ